MAFSAYAHTTTESDSLVQASESSDSLTQAEKKIREEESQNLTTEKYAVYEQYGLTYDKEKDRFFYDGKMVRFFRDITDAAGTINGFSYNDGVVDLQGVRDASYKLIGLKKVSQKKLMKKQRNLWIRSKPVMV